MGEKNPQEFAIPQVLHTTCDKTLTAVVQCDKSQREGITSGSLSIYSRFFPTLLCLYEALQAALGPGLGQPAQQGHGRGAEGGHEDAQRAGGLPLQRQAGGAALIQPREEKTSGKSSPQPFDYTKIDVLHGLTVSLH